MNLKLIYREFTFCHDHRQIFLLAICIPMTFTDTITRKIPFNQSNDTKLYTEITRTFQHEKMHVNHTSPLQENSSFWNRVFSSEKEFRLKRAATRYKEKLWNYGVIPYTIIEHFFTPREKKNILNAMQTWEKETCIIFKDKEPKDKDYIVFSIDSCGCCSEVGKTGMGAQNVSIDKQCNRYGIVLHELGHVIGFWHEHVRPDRDKFIHIKLDNVKENKKNNFKAKSSSEVDSLDEPYDYNSIMHYSNIHFSKNDMKTIMVKNQPGKTSVHSIGQRFQLSPGDIRQTNKLYNCSSCGSTLSDISGAFNFSSNLGKIDACQWRIKAGHGERIELNITSLSLTYSKNCKNSYLEIRDGHYAKSPSLGRYCGKNLPGVIVSSGRRMWIEFKSLTIDSFSAEYKVLCGGDIKQNEGFITSQGYPHIMYPPNSHCVWNITVTKKFVVVLRIDFLDIENSNNGECFYDYLEVRDGHRNTDKSLRKFCSNDQPGEIRSTGNKMTLIFVSDEDIQKNGFTAKFVAEK